MENQKSVQSANHIFGMGKIRVEQRKSARDHLLMALGGKCKNCGIKRNLYIDHTIPLSNGGNDRLHNLQLLCKKCHKKKIEMERKIYIKTHGEKRIVFVDSEIFSFLLQYKIDNNIYSNSDALRKLLPIKKKWKPKYLKLRRAIGLERFKNNGEER